MIRNRDNDEISEDEDNTSTVLLDIGLFLDRLDGKKDLTARLINLFLKHFMEKQTAIKKAIDDKNPGAVKTSAHSLKGMLLHFCKKSADLAYQLENMGDSGKIDIEKANTVYDNLKIIIDQIVPKLEEYQRKFKNSHIQ